MIFRNSKQTHKHTATNTVWDFVVQIAQPDIPALCVCVCVCVCVDGGDIIAVELKLGVYCCIVAVPACVCV